MSEIPAGPAKIKITSRVGSVVTFQFVSFPGQLRPAPHVGGGYPIGENSTAVQYGRWHIKAISHPASTGNNFYCPGGNRNMDDRAMEWRSDLSELCGILKAINVRAGVRQSQWEKLRARILAYRERIDE